MRDVEGKVAFITGGDSGIGLGIARSLVNAGMKVVITYRSRLHLDDAMEALKSAADRVHAVNVDVTDRDAMLAAAAETEQVFGKVHVLVNNAGVAPLVPLSSATFDDWDWCMSINVNGVFNGVRAFLPRIRAHSEGGQLVATSSMVGGLVVGPFWGVYSTSKFAIVGMMEALRAELANTNVGVSVLCPAGVSSNIGDSSRNRPATLAETGVSDPSAVMEIEQFRTAMQGAIAAHAGSQLLMDAAEVGERVLQGIRNNDLYILTHAEHEQLLRDRSEALLASIPTSGPAPTEGRRAVAAVLRTPIYVNELNRRLRARERSPQTSSR